MTERSRGGTLILPCAVCTVDGRLGLATKVSGLMAGLAAAGLAALASTGVTVLMTSELEDRYGDLRFSPYGTAFLTDAIVLQRYVEVDSRLQRVMAVVKVRGSAHSNELRSFTIDDQGIQIGDMLLGQEGLLGGAPSRRPSFQEAVTGQGHV